MNATGMPRDDAARGGAGTSGVGVVLNAERTDASAAGLDMRDRHLGAALAAWQAHEEARAISERVLAAHDEQVARLTKPPPVPVSGTMRWSVALGSWQFDPASEDFMDALMDAVRGGSIKVTIHF